MRSGCLTDRAECANIRVLGCKGENMAELAWNAVDAYFDTELNGAEAVLGAALKASVAAGLPSIQVSAAQGKLLYLLALAQSAKRILEVGTLGGYSALWLARALPTDGRLVTLEVNPRHAEIARRNFETAKVADRIDLRVAPALETFFEGRVSRRLTWSSSTRTRSTIWGTCRRHWSYPESEH
jgi:predicted O-methyltransferase YrrM